MVGRVAHRHHPFRDMLKLFRQEIVFQEGPLNDALTCQVIFYACGKEAVTEPTSALARGAVHKDIYESDINLQISEVLSTTLGEMGAIVYMTRYGDYDLGVINALNRKRSDLSRRGNIINRSNCDLYISIHLNAVSSPVWYGAQVFYDDVHEENERLAKIMQEELARYLKTKRKYKKTNDMYLHKRIQHPGILIEVGFLSNPNERYLLRQKYYQQKVSRAIASGVVKFLIK